MRTQHLRRWRLICSRAGIFRRGSTAINIRHRPAGAAWQAGEPADTRRGRRAVDGREIAGATRRTTMARSTSTTTISVTSAGQADFTWTVPDDLRSGAYALHLTCEVRRRLAAVLRVAAAWRAVRTDRVPRVDVHLSGLRQPRARHTTRRITTASTPWGAYPDNPDDYPEYGRSTYNRHRDGSGICFSSRRGRC